MSDDDVADTPPLECELKLAGGLGALRKAETQVRKAVGGTVAWETVKLATTYYDTVDRRLSRRNVAFRVRKKGRSYTQTVKAKPEDTAAIAVRAEWNVELPNAKPDMQLLPHDARARTGLVLPGELKRLFTVDVERKQATVTISGAGGESAVVEIAIDRGKVSAGRKSSPVIELEIELMSGTLGPIYELAANLVDCGLAVSQVTKAERGFNLIDGAKLPEPVKAPKFLLTPDQRVTDALYDIFSAGLANVLENEAPSLDGTDPEGVHQMRVSIRRMRSAFSVFNRLLDPESIAWAKDELKWLGGVLGPARDWDVFTDEILSPVDGYGIDPDGIAALKTAAEAQRKQAYEDLRAQLASPRYAKVILGMSRFIDAHAWMPADAGPDHPLNATIGSVSDAIMTNAYKKLRKRGRGLAEMEIEARHEVRIELKKFRYTMDYLQALYPAQSTKPFIKALSRMQDQFGHLNDVSVAVDLLDQLTAAKGQTAADKRLRTFAAGKVIGWHARGLHEYEESFIEDWMALKNAPKFWKRARRG